MLICHRKSAFSYRSVWLNSLIWVYWGQRDSYCLATSRWTLLSQGLTDNSVPYLILHPSEDMPMYLFLLILVSIFITYKVITLSSKLSIK